MRTAVLALSSLALLLPLAPPVSADVIELQNDGFMSGQAAGFQGGFVSGEIGAVRLDPPTADPVQILEVKLLFGGATSTQNVTLQIWNEVGGASPGAMIHQADYTLTGANDAFSSIDLSGDNLFVTGSFRVGILFQHAGFPSIARDDDGTIRPTHNFIMAQGFGWAQSNLFGLTGDWVIRATIDDGMSTTPDAGVPDAMPAPDASPPDAGNPGPDAGETPDANEPGPDAGPDGQACRVHSECPTGQYCDESDMCTYDCRVDYDCGNDMRCTSLGMCEALPDTGCGCRVGEGRPDDNDRGLGWILGLGLGAAVWLRRRRRKA